MTKALYGGYQLAQPIENPSYTGINNDKDLD